MTKDKALEELFLTQKPHFDDHDAFMADLTKRLDAVEFIRQHQEAAIRRYKMAMVAAFVVGIVSLSTPADVPLFTFHFETSILLWFAKNSRPIAATALTLAMTLSMLSIINNVQDIMRMLGNDVNMLNFLTREK